METVILTLRVTKDQKQAIEDRAWRERTSVNKLLAPVIKKFAARDNSKGGGKGEGKDAT